MSKRAFSLLLVAFGGASGQSTAALGAFEPPTTYQISAGMNSHLIPAGYAGGIRSALAVDASVHRTLQGVMNLRADGWFVDHTSVDPNEYQYGVYRYDAATGQYLTPEPKNALLLAAVISASFPFHLAPDLVIGPTLGLGVVPIAQGRFREVVLDQNGSSSGSVTSTTSHGYLLAAGVSLRWRHLVIEQHILQVTGADHALGNGENAPFTVGWRF